MFLTIDEFISSPHIKSSWIKHPDFSTIHFRRVKKKEIECIEIFVLQAKISGEGSFTRLRERLKNYNLYLCCVGNRRFARHLSKIGGIRIFEPHMPHASFLLKI